MVCIVTPAVQMENIKQLVRVHTVAQRMAQPETCFLRSRNPQKVTLITLRNYEKFLRNMSKVCTFSTYKHRRDLRAPTACITLLLYILQDTGAGE